MSCPSTEAASQNKLRAGNIQLSVKTANASIMVDGHSYSHLTANNHRHIGEFPLSRLDKWLRISGKRLTFIRILPGVWDTFIVKVGQLLNVSIAIWWETVRFIPSVYG